MPNKRNNGSKSVFGPRTNASFGDGSEHARNAKELVVRMFDWFTVPLPKYVDPQTGAGVKSIYTYGFDLTQNFLGPIVETSTSATKNRIRKVHLDVMTPGGPIDYTVGGSTQPGTSATTSLPMLLTAVPCLEYEANSTTDTSPSSLVGQSNLVLHPDVRRPWMTVGSWDYTRMFKDTQIQPWYADKAGDQGYMELFRLQAVDGATGAVMCAASGSGPVTFNAEELCFRVMIEIACPVGLVPDPKRITGSSEYFAGANYAPTYAKDKSPMQFQLMGLQNAL